MREEYLIRLSPSTLDVVARTRADVRAVAGSGPGLRLFAHACKMAAAGITTCVVPATQNAS